MEGFVYVLASNENFEETKSDIVAIYYPWIKHMNDAVELSKNQKISKNQIDDLIEVLDLIRIITRSTYNNIRGENKSIFQIIFVEIWGTIQYIFLNIKVLIKIFLLKI